MNDRKIKLAITLDDNGGMMFNKRRQSRDKRLIADLCAKTTGYIYISPYSELLFEEYRDRIQIVGNPLSECPDGAVAFTEGLLLGSYVNDIDELFVYKWNTLYPSDIKIDIDIKGSGFKMIAKYEFTGNSHDKITKEVYKKI